jgi:hypothetical protein
MIKKLITLGFLLTLCLSSVGWAQAGSNVKFDPVTVYVKPGDQTVKQVNITLTEKPAKQVTLKLSQAYSDTNYVNVKGLTPTVTFTSSNYNKPQKVSFAVNGSYKASDINLIIADGMEGSKRFAGSFNVNISNLDIDNQGHGMVVSDPVSLTLTDGDYTKKMISISLSKDPKGTVTINVTKPTDDSGLFSLGKRSFTFNSSNYKTPQSYGVTLNKSAKSVATQGIVFEGANSQMAYGGITVIDTNQLANSATFNSMVPDIITGDQLPGTSLKLPEIFSRLINVFIWIITVAAFAGIIYSGFMYITAGGDSSKAELGRKNLTWSIIGIIIALCSFLIVNFAAGWMGIDTTRTKDSDNTTGTGTSTGSGITAGNMTVVGMGGLDPSQMTLDPNTEASTVIGYQLTFKNPPAENEQIAVEIIKEGAAPIYVDQSGLIVTKSNYDSVDFVFNATYSGGGTDGQKAKIIVKTSQGDRAEMYITLQSEATSGSGSGSSSQ